MRPLVIVRVYILIEKKSQSLSESALRNVDAVPSCFRDMLEKV